MLFIERGKFMKKKLIATVCASLMAFSLVSCGGEKKEAEQPTSKPAEEQEAKLKEGTYEAETKNADDRGNKAKIVVKVDSEGKITNVDYNEFNAEKKENKRDNEEYNKSMKEKVGTSPAEFEPTLEKQIVEKQSAEIDGVTNATSSSTLAKKLAAEAINNAKEGKTDIALVE